MSLELNDLDRRIWDEELNDYVPQRVYDAHTHIYRWAYNLDPNKENGPTKEFVRGFEEANWDCLQSVDAQLFPGRTVHRLAFPYPFPQCDFNGMNHFISGEVAHDRQSGSLMLVHPGMTAEEIEPELDRGGHLGFKPYRFYSSTGDAVNCTIPQFMPEHQIEIAHRRGLIIMMHVSKRDAIADPDNMADMVRLCDKYPNAKWILAHCARSYSNWAIETAAPALKGLPNVWYDTSSVCESDAVAALCANVGWERVMYGSDDVPVGVVRGKYIAFGRAWAYLSPTNQSFNLSHCDDRFTFTRYEQLRAMRQATERLGLGKAEVQRMFYDTAKELVSGVKRGVVTTN